MKTVLLVFLLVLAGCETTIKREIVEVPLTMTCGEKPVDMPPKEFALDHLNRIIDAGVYVRRLENALSIANDRIAACNGEAQLKQRMSELNGRTKGN